MSSFKKARGVDVYFSVPRSGKIFSPSEQRTFFSFKRGSGGRCQTGKIVARRVGSLARGKYWRRIPRIPCEAVSFLSNSPFMIGGWKESGRYRRVGTKVIFGSGVKAVVPYIIGEWVGETVIPNITFAMRDLPWKHSALFSVPLEGLIGGEWVRQVRLSPTFSIAMSKSSLALFLVTILMFSLLLAPSGELVVAPSSMYVAPHTTARDLNFTRPLSYKKERHAARRMLLGGKRPVVRGTVRNPGDHPHGGRTRSIPFPLTPWAKVVLKSTRWPIKEEHEALTHLQRKRARQRPKGIKMSPLALKPSRQVVSKHHSRVWAQVPPTVGQRHVRVNKLSYIGGGLDGFFIVNLVRRFRILMRVCWFSTGLLVGELFRTRKLSFYQSRTQKKKKAKAAEKAAKAKSKKQPEFRKGKRIKRQVRQISYRAVRSASGADPQWRRLEIRVARGPVASRRKRRTKLRPLKRRSAL